VIYPAICLASHAQELPKQFFYCLSSGFYCRLPTKDLSNALYCRSNLYFIAEAMDFIADNRLPSYTHGNHTNGNHTNGNHANGKHLASIGTIADYLIADFFRDYPIADYLIAECHDYFFKKTPLD
jgi:hypothetical protein